MGKKQKQKTVICISRSHRLEWKKICQQIIKYTNNFHLVKQVMGKKKQNTIVRFLRHIMRTDPAKQQISCSRR